MRLLQRLSFCLTVISGLGFLCLYLFRTELYAITEIQPATFAELHPVSENALAITAFKTDSSDGPRLKVLLKNANDRTDWRIASQNETPLNSTGEFPVIPLRQGTFDHTITPVDCILPTSSPDEIQLSLYFGYAEDFGAQASTSDQFQVNSANIPVLMSAPEPISRWIPDVEGYSPSEAKKAWSYLLGAGFDPAASSRGKIEFLTTLIRMQMPSGTPPARLNALSPWSVFTQKHSDGDGSFCRQWSLGYGHLANLVDLPTRNLFTGGAMGNVDMGSPAFSET